LRDPYLDSELDARTTLELEQHLQSCPECSRSYADEQKLNEWMTSGLKRGHQSASLWDQIETAVRKSSVIEKSAVSTPRTTQRGLWPYLGAAIAARFRTYWREAPMVWSALAAAWLVVLVLNLTGREPETATLARQATPSASVLRLALSQRQQALAELSWPAETPLPSSSKRPAAAPRSEKNEHRLRA